MRSGACTVQQTLTTEAASVLKHSLSLARRRGHAQVTPLHVAATLLSLRASLLRRACLKSQPHQSSHPLQCRALELCFNVALNRLPTTPGPLLHGQPSLSNALIAALKRAQAHQRRGCIEQQQQQPLLTIKVELEQLIISILDDPSVSRVMREAGFSSTAVKNNIEDSSASSVFQCYSTSGGVFSSPCSPSPTDTQRDIINPNIFWQTHFLSYSSEQHPVLFSPQKRVSSNYITDSASLKEDIKLVLEVLLRKKKRNTVIVGDCVATTEGLVAELMGRVERGDVPDELKQTHFIKFQFAPVALRFMKNDDIETNIIELKRKVESFTSRGGGAIVYTGDLKWTVEEGVNGGRISTYSPVDHLVAEIGRLVSEYNSSNTKVWFVATASYQTYMRCQMRQPPLEIQWAVQAVSVPSGGLGLSLYASSGHDSRIIVSQNPSQVLETKPFDSKEEQDKLTLCAECSSNYEKEAQTLKSAQQKLLPPWLQQHGSNATRKDDLLDLRKKWNRYCHSLHQGRHNQSHLGSTICKNQNLLGKGYSDASSYRWWPTQSNMFTDSASISFVDSTLKPNHSPNTVPKFRRQNSCTIEFNFGNGNGTHKHQPGEPSLDSFKNTEGKEVKITLALGHSVFSEKARCETTMQLSDLSKLLQESVPWQSETVCSIAEALMDSKSTKKDTWMLIQGNDTTGKRRLARAIADSVFGSAEFLLHMDLGKRDSEASPFCKMLTSALRSQEMLVVLMENVDLADEEFMKFLAQGMETGNFGELNRRESNIGHSSVFILTKDDASSNVNEKRSQDFAIRMTLKVKERSPQKRKIEWEFTDKNKSPRMAKKENASCLGAEDGIHRQKFSRQSSFNTLDLNMKADEDDDSEEKQREFGPISSDVSRESSSDRRVSNGFLDLIQNRFVFDRNVAQEREMTEFFSTKMKGSFEEVFGGQNTVSFSVEERVVEEVCAGSGSFLDNLFEKWLKEVFQTSLQTIKNGREEGISVRLCLGGIEEKVLEDGFMGTCLPQRIQVSLVD